MNSKDVFTVGTAVEWKWMGGCIKGTVIEIYFAPVSKEIKGKWIRRNGSEENPAFLVKSAAGNLALKLKSELSISSRIHLEAKNLRKRRSLFD